MVAKSALLPLEKANNLGFFAKGVKLRLKQIVERLNRNDSKSNPNDNKSNQKNQTIHVVLLVICLLAVVLIDIYYYYDSQENDLEYSNIER